MPLPGHATRSLHRLAPVLVFGAVLVSSALAQTIEVPNGGFEQVKPGSKLPDRWETGISPGTGATIERDEGTSHSGRASVKITDSSPTAPYVYAFVRSPAIPVQPETTYDVRLFVRARKLRNCSVGVDQPAGDTFREPLPAGTYDWQPVTLTVATQPRQTVLTIHVVADGPTEALWVDDVSLAVSARRRARLAEVEYPKDFPGMFPRPQGELDRHLLVCLTSADDGRTWHDHAVSEATFSLYAVGGCRELTDDGAVIGAFTDTRDTSARPGGSRVYFFRIDTGRGTSRGRPS